eukprot:TRINITY_DN2545_c0_g1_i1.p1 TRINITY_DN2545_c0_g1~~TRINITY_DN2545_c0_g1_i1.p1  ORF type:complete len:198 (+),score=21.42 TRINITY_DN2545_c0_g1_i1:124-717(+)
MCFKRKSAGGDLKLKGKNVQSTLCDQYDFLCKVILVGESGVGKSSLLLRFTDDQFAEEYISTVGVDFKSKTITLADGKVSKMQIWDTAGQERFKTITVPYYRNADGVIAAYDITNKKSFDCVSKWLTDVDKHATKKTAKMIIGTKADLESQRQVSESEGQNLANQMGIPFSETSSKTSKGVDNAFTILATAIGANQK